MTAPHAQPKARRERRIIERPRLIKLLDECEARIILLLAPAGYGKTTLARQWAKTLNGAIWISCTPAHRDVAVLAEDLGRSLDKATARWRDSFAGSSPLTRIHNLSAVRSREPWSNTFHREIHAGCSLTTTTSWWVDRSGGLSSTRFNNRRVAAS